MIGTLTRRIRPSCVNQGVSVDVVCFARCPDADDATVRDFRGNAALTEEAPAHGEVVVLGHERIFGDKPLGILARTEDPHGSGGRIRRLERSQRDESAAGCVESFEIGLVARVRFHQSRAVGTFAQAVQDDEFHVSDPAPGHQPYSGPTGSGRRCPEACGPAGWPVPRPRSGLLWAASRVRRGAVPRPSGADRTGHR